MFRMVTHKRGCWKAGQYCCAGLVGGLVLVAALLTSASLWLAAVLFGAALMLGGALLASMAVFAARHRLLRIIIAVVTGCVFAGLGVVVYSAAQRIPRIQTLSVCGSRLRTVHHCLLAYYDRHQRFPRSLRTLVDEGVMDGDLLYSPCRAHVSRATCDYAYVAGLKPSDPPAWPIVFDLADVHEDGARTVVCLSGESCAMTGRQFEAWFVQFKEEYALGREAAPTIVRER